MNTMQERKEEEELGGVGAVRRAAFLSHLTSTRWGGFTAALGVFHSSACRSSLRSCRPDWVSQGF